MELEKKVKDLESSLNYERSARKRAESELASFKRSQADEDEVNKTVNEMRAKLKNGNSELSDEVIEDFVNVFGKAQAEESVKTKKQNIERDILELRREYMNVEERGEEVRDLMKKGLTAKQAYWAVFGGEVSIPETKDEVEEERKKEGYVETKPAGEEKRDTYSSRERTIADVVGKSPEEVRERSKNIMSIDSILNIKKKFKKED